MLKNIAIAVFAVIIISGCDSRPWHERDNSVAAYVTMTEYVKRRLRSPSTADFPLINKVRVKRLADHKYEVFGYVDAQNGFGATVRTRYFGVLQQGGRHEWRLLELTILE